MQTRHVLVFLLVGMSCSLDGCIGFYGTQQQVVQVVDAETGEPVAFASVRGHRSNVLAEQPTYPEFLAYQDDLPQAREVEAFYAKLNDRFERAAAGELVH